MNNEIVNFSTDFTNICLLAELLGLDSKSLPVEVEVIQKRIKGNELINSSKYLELWSLSTLLHTSRWFKEDVYMYSVRRACYVVLPLLQWLRKVGI